MGRFIIICGRYLLNMKKAIILARVSTEEQTEGHSIPAQLERARQYCRHKELLVQSEHPFDESSLKDKRTKFEAVIHEIEKSTESLSLIVETIDRLQRSFKESVLFEKFRKQGKLEIHFIRENLIVNKESNSSELIRWDMGVMFARSYVLQISDNVKRSQKHKLEKGEYPGPAPFGYKNTTGENNTKNIEPDSFKANIVKKIFELYASGAYSMDEVRKKIKDEYTITVHKSKVDHILKNPFYHGEMRYKGALYPHRYKTLIPRETFNTAQNIKKSYKKTPFKHAGLPYLYRGLIKCDDCGCLFTPEKKKKQYVYYHCTEYKGKHGTKWIREEEITRQFSQALDNIKVPQEVAKDICNTLRASHKGKKDYHETMYKQLTSEHQKYTSRIENMYEDKLDGLISQEYYTNKVSGYRSKQNEIQEKLNNLKKADEDYYISAEYILNLANRASALFKSSEPKLKRQILKLALQNCTIKDENLSFTYKNPFNVLAEGVYCNNWLPGQDSNLRQIG